MRLHRFFVSQKLEEHKTIFINDKNLLHQWKDVFRLKAGDSVVLLDNSGFEFHATFTLLSNRDGAELNMGAIKKSLNIPQKELYLFAALIKKDNFEWVIEKATELGVSHIVPVVSERSEKKDLNVERAQKILREASEQSYRGTLPTLHEVVSLEDALHNFDIPLVSFHVEGEKFDVKQHVSQHKVGLLIGPEGGWSDKELALFREKNIPICSLGSQVLRAETAAIATLSLVLL